MEVLSISDMELVSGGKVTTAAKVCALVGLSSGGFAIGAAFNWWNPAGWICDVVVAVGAVCDLYTIYSIGETIIENS